MSLLVVAYPEIAPADYAWVQALRAQHDPHARLIAPHFTLVFPTSALGPGELAAHVAAQATISSFAWTIRCATFVKDAFGPLTHLFLVPDEGYSSLVKLHEALYTEHLASELSIDVPFIPHITVGAHADPRVVQGLAAELNRTPVSIAGRVGALDVIAHEQGAVTTVARVALR